MFFANGQRTITLTRFLPEAKPTGLVETMSVRTCVANLMREAFGSQLMEHAYPLVTR